MQEYFMKTEDIGFSNWSASDLELAFQLWGEKDVTRYICATGKFTEEDILRRLSIEINNGEKYHVQYWPIFELISGELIGCCGVRPFKLEYNTYEIGFHLRKKYWGKGYGFKSAKAVIDYCFTELNALKLYAGHHPSNKTSKKLLNSLGFKYIGDNYYEPTGLNHPSYEMENPRL
ncbi:GNAT family N-acetyltransferase [Clostridium paraputrificum]|uniref:GNAT family N-acetyltransferase n=1 Tax=Clostridium paraputrificum TaxID=29363 RepID=UPI003D331198